jgi:hypothetical protein
MRTTDSKPVTIREMCETIERARILRKTDGTHPTAREIFEYSPTGELYMLCEWHQLALEVLGKEMKTEH